MHTLMIQGTTSDAGKSTLVAGLCRVFANQGMKVAPFKPQNMALNSAVTEDGGEIGRAQALQAIAAKVPLQVDFNPILLKPNSDTGAQVIIHGKAISNMEAQGYHDYKKVAMQAVLESHQRLSEKYDSLIVEGAGSPAEINLRENDIANMGYAEEVDCPVIIVADIDKGGVFAHLVGTLELLSPSEQNRVKGFIINRFRGDINLLTSGLDWLEQKTNKPVLGVMPYLHDLALDAEDAINITNRVASNESLAQNQQRLIKIAVLLLPHISNHTDFDTLRLQTNVDLAYVKIGEQIPAVDLIILPGSKNVISDLSFLKSQGWQEQILRHLRYGGKVLGICGGYQMLGQQLLDPDEIESTQKAISGLGLLPTTTTLTPSKTLTQVEATLNLNNEQCAIQGYEIHCGITRLETNEKSQLSSLITACRDKHTASKQTSEDGLISLDNQIIGTYLHGLFDNSAATELILRWVLNLDKSESGAEGQAVNLAQHREQQLERLAQTCEQHLDIKKIIEILGRVNL